MLDDQTCTAATNTPIICVLSPTILNNAPANINNQHMLLVLVHAITAPALLASSRTQTSIAFYIIGHTRPALNGCCHGLSSLCKIKISYKESFNREHASSTPDIIYRIKTDDSKSH